MKYKGFAIVTMARSGSYLLVDLLNQIEGCHCLGEIFKANFLELDDYFKDEIKKRGWFKPMRDRKPIAYIEEIYKILPGKITGFKIFTSHNEKALKYIISSQDIFTIFLYRNPLSRYISQIRAEATGVWIQKNEENSPANLVNGVNVEFEVNRFNHFIDECNNLKIMFEQRVSDNKIFVEYNQVVDLNCIKPISERLNLLAPPLHAIQHRLKKQIDIPYNKLVSNYNTMHAFLSKNHPELLNYL